MRIASDDLSVENRRREEASLLNNNAAHTVLKNKRIMIFQSRIDPQTAGLWKNMSLAMGTFRNRLMLVAIDSEKVAKPQ